MCLQTQPTQAFTFFGSYLLERQLVALLKIAERGWEPARDKRADDANGISPVRPKPVPRTTQHAAFNEAAAIPAWQRTMPRPV